MRLFPRKPSRTDAPDSESAVGVEVIRRIKVTTDRYWVTSEQSGEAMPDDPLEAAHGASTVGTKDSRVLSSETEED
jgi:hypothetical protein